MVFWVYITLVRQITTYSAVVWWRRTMAKTTVKWAKKECACRHYWRHDYKIMIEMMCRLHSYGLWHDDRSSGPRKLFRRWRTDVWRSFEWKCVVTGKQWKDPNTQLTSSVKLSILTAHRLKMALALECIWSICKYLRKQTGLLAKDGVGMKSGSWQLSCS